MTDENQEAHQDDKVEIDYKAEFEKAQADIERMQAKNNELLGETKKAKEARRQLEAEDKERAKKNGDFERLLQSAEDERNKAFEELNSYKQEALKQNINAKALKITNELKAIPESAELLAHFVANELKSIADEKGEVSETALNALKHQFINDDKYKPLLLGNQSNGGGATGAKSSAHKSNEISRADFEKMDASKKMEFIKAKGTLTD